MAALQLRPMQVDDTAAVAALEASLQFHPWTEKQFLESLAMQHPALVACLGDDICGFAVSMHVVDEATLLEIGVAQAQQRMGIGAQLLQASLDIASENGMAVMHLEVRHSNKAAYKLYRKFGFVEVGRRRGYYRAAISAAHPDGREDAIVLALTLDEGAR